MLGHKVALTDMTVVTGGSDNGYASTDGLALAREHDTLTPNGNLMNGRWVLRSANGDLLDFDRYLNDIVDRQNLRLLTVT